MYTRVYRRVSFVGCIGVVVGKGGGGGALDGGLTGLFIS